MAGRRAAAGRASQPVNQDCTSMLPFIYVLFPSIVTGAAGGRRRGVDRRALAARYRALLALPDAERTDEERARVRQIVTLRLLEHFGNTCKVEPLRCTATILRSITY